MKLSFSKFLIASCAVFFAVNATENVQFLERKTKKTTTTKVQYAKEKEMQKIVLYIKPTCPFCIKVMNVLEEMGKSVEIKDISSDSALRDELISIGGKKQVPCIVVDGKAKYESSDIIEWLIQNKDLL